MSKQLNLSKPNARNVQRKKGFTLTEMLVVIGIIVVLCAIAIPSIISVRKTLSFKQKNDYAQSLFMAAQSNLTEKRSNGQLVNLQRDGIGAAPVDAAQFPSEEWVKEYCYTYTGTAAYDMVIPGGSVDESVRNKGVLVEYNPLSGNVYAVFYSESMTGEELRNTYAASGGTGLPRDTDERKKINLGYYCGSGLSGAGLSDSAKNVISEAEFTYQNDAEGIVAVDVPIPDEYQKEMNTFIDGLEVKLTIKGVPLDTALGADGKPQAPEAPDPSKEIVITLKETGSVPTDPAIKCDFGHTSKSTARIEFALDSLHDCFSFANISANDPTAAPASGKSSPIRYSKSLTTLTDETKFKILPGQNVVLKADIKFTEPHNHTSVTVTPTTITVNPLFESMQKLESATGNDKYLITISNARNLQNLNILSPQIADKVSVVSITSDIDWNETVEYYGTRYVDGYDPADAGRTEYRNAAGEAPARALPYFVPVHNEYLFGTAQFIYPDSPENAALIGTMFDSSAVDASAALNAKVPVLTDELYRNADTSYATIQCGKYDETLPSSPAEERDKVTAKISNINIDATKYSAGVNKFYATGPSQMIDYNFTGVFAYLDTEINNVDIVNPIVKGHPFNPSGKQIVPVYEVSTSGGKTNVKIKNYNPNGDAANNPATGALVGAVGGNAQIRGCGVYIDKPSYTQTQNSYHKDAAQTWYGVSGEGAVGGLVGYAKSHASRKAATFSESFAAVPVSGNMRDAHDRLYGYSNGIGGMVGNANLANFFDCYASGNVSAAGYHLSPNAGSKHVYGLDHDGNLSFGAGGLVGTCHGNYFTNCFATGSVTASGSGSAKLGGAGSFVGFMAYDAYGTYGIQPKTVKPVQHTIFTNCYATGDSVATDSYSNKHYETFAGASGNVQVVGGISSFYSPDYYETLAPFYLKNGNKTPTRTDNYVFRDSFFLSKYGKNADSVVNSVKCADTIGYDTLEKLPELSKDEAFVKDQITALKAQSVTAESLTSFGGAASVPRFPTFQYYFNQRSGLDDVYINTYKTGFAASSVWMAASEKTADMTHAYEAVHAGKVYPFPQIKNMPYYGNWPDKEAEAKLVYFEDYVDASKPESTPYRGYKLDGGMGSNELDTFVPNIVSENLNIVYDGYTLLSTSSAPLTFHVGGTSKTIRPSMQTITLGNSQHPSNRAYYAYELNADFVKSMKCQQFYNSMSFNVNGKPGVIYFNPNVACSQVNPSSGLIASSPSALPDSLLIRTNRQFRMLSEPQMAACLVPECHYVQVFDLEPSAYNWAKADISQPTLSSIGCEDGHPFNASYTSDKTLIDSVKTLKGYLPNTAKANAGVFSVIGSSGSVHDLNIDFVMDETLGSSSGNTHLGLAAGVNDGALQNITLDIAAGKTGSANLNAGTGAGLLAGCSGGVISNCAVNVPKTLSTEITATENAGAFVGMTTGGEIHDITFSLPGSLTVGGKFTGGFTGNSNATKFANISVTLSSAASTSDAAAGFAGKLTDGSVNNVSANLDGKFTCSGMSMAGFAAEADGTALQNINVNLRNADLESSSKDGTAAGFAGILNCTAENCLVSGHGTIHSTANGTASGFVSNAGANAKLSNCGVTPVPGHGSDRYVGESNGNLTITSTTGSAVGFAGHTEAGSDLSHCFTLCALNSKSSSGFVADHNGNISLSSANVDMVGGHAFAAHNNGKVTDCYGWYGDGKKDSNTTKVVDKDEQKKDKDGNIIVTSTSHYYSSFFADRDCKILLVNDALKPVDDKKNALYPFVSAIMFDKTGKGTRQFPASISPAKLGSNVWKNKNTCSKFPYRADFYDAGHKTVTQSYPLPMFADHFGNWPELADAACGVAYYEQYTDANGKHPVAVYPRNFKKTAFSIPENWYGHPSENELKLYDSGYAVYYMKGLSHSELPIDESILLPDLIDTSDNKTGDDIFGKGVPYTFQKINPDKFEKGQYECCIARKRDPNDKITFSFWFAKEFDTKDGKFELRTGDQLGHMGSIMNNPSLKKNGTVFNQTHDIIVTDQQADNFDTIKNFDGTFNGGKNDININKSFNWIDTVNSGFHLSNMGNINYNNDATKPLIGIMSPASTITSTGINVTGDVNSPEGIFTTTGSSAKSTLGKVNITGTVNGTVIKEAHGWVDFDTMDIDTVGSTGSVFEKMYDCAIYFDQPGKKLNIRQLDGHVVNFLTDKGNFSCIETNITDCNNTVIETIKGGHINQNVGNASVVNITNMNAPYIGNVEAGNDPNEISSVYWIRLNVDKANLNIGADGVTGLLVRTIEGGTTESYIKDCKLTVSDIAVKGKGDFGLIAGHVRPKSNVTQCVVNAPDNADKTIHLVMAPGVTAHQNLHYMFGKCDSAVSAPECPAIHISTQKMAVFNSQIGFHAGLTPKGFPLASANSIVYNPSSEQ